MLTVFSTEARKYLICNLMYMFGKVGKYEDI